MTPRWSSRTRAPARLVATLLLATAGALTLCTPAPASSGAYVFDGGTPAERQTVAAALAASAFDWSAVPGTVTIHIGSYPTDEAAPGQIYLDARLLDSGLFAWGVVQHEYAHQVDFALLDDGGRARLAAALGAQAWCYDAAPSLPHEAYGCERFASTLAWAYWPDAANCMSPAALGAESGALAPAAFRALLQSVLGPVARPVAPRFARLLRTTLRRSPRR